jgi:hypothetical protein
MEDNFQANWRKGKAKGRRQYILSPALVEPTIRECQQQIGPLLSPSLPRPKKFIATFHLGWQAPAICAKVPIQMQLVFSTLPLSINDSA